MKKHLAEMKKLELHMKTDMEAMRNINDRREQVGPQMFSLVAVTSVVPADLHTLSLALLIGSRLILSPLTHS